MNKKVFAVQKDLSSQDLKNVRKRMGLTQEEFAGLVNVSVKTIARWEISNKPITGPIVTLVRILNEYPRMEEQFLIPKKEYPMRLWFMHNDDVCTLIDVDEPQQAVRIYNITNQYMLRAFGREERPTFKDYEAFLESRCFPRSRDKMKLVLKDLGLPFYDPLMIIEKTQGRMAEDNFWIKIER